jgi:hypothetical protein
MAILIGLISRPVATRSITAAAIAASTIVHDNNPQAWTLADATVQWHVWADPPS